jgi:hypothetical protein
MVQLSSFDRSVSNEIFLGKEAFQELLCGFNGLVYTDRGKTDILLSAEDQKVPDKVGSLL